MARREIGVEALKHRDARRRNIPTAELESVMPPEQKSPVRITIERRNRDLDPQLVWRGKDEQDWSDLIVPAPPLFIQEKVHPKVLIDDLRRRTKERAREAEPAMPDLFRLQRPAGRGGQDRVLPARPELVEPDDPRRLAGGDGEFGRAGGAAGDGAVHLH